MTGWNTVDSPTNMRFLCALCLWLLLLVVCWPLALAVLVLAPILWIASIPFRLAWWCLEAALALVRALLFLPARLLGASRAGA